MVRPSAWCLNPPCHVVCSCQVFNTGPGGLCTIRSAWCLHEHMVNCTAFCACDAPDVQRLHATECETRAWRCDVNVSIGDG